ncbi:agmatine deiminase family protein [Aeromonas dhakensis]|uniref:agmatine deiminase family protein n=1 Tax=Aeromonas dhakensis TaxID=196024 RepID=UPI001AAE3D35|nr:agmatine deiminase family protein [Aeromonas dhakensis]MBO2903015.1 agmatine deiminase family protein [Aeromonas dhakensis]MBO2997348.1 agmatine deiminase family protein [Aeromonas dhakensis]
MSSRRNVLKQLAAIGALAGLGNLPGKVNAASNNAGEDTATSGEPFHMPDEAASQTRVWVAFAASADIWGRDYQEVQATIGRLVQAMVPYTQVNVLCRATEQALARQLCGEQNTRFVVAELDDIWLRDTGGVFVQNGEGALGLVDFNFNGWGDKQEHEQDAEVAELISQQASARYLRSKLTGEGGGIEVDGKGTAIMTESCWLNSNRNPGVSKAQLEAELKANLGLRKIIWLPGIKGRDITDAHVDFYARFVRPGVVLVNLDNDPHSHDYEVTRRHLAILRQATDADGNKLELHVLPPPLDGRDNRFSRSRDFAAGYISYLPINGAVIAPEFGDKAADSYCHELLARLYPGRDIVQINIDPVAAGGGGIHCITLHQPA